MQRTQAGIFLLGLSSPLTFIFTFECVVELQRTSCEEAETRSPEKMSLQDLYRLRRAVGRYVQSGCQFFPVRVLERVLRDICPYARDTEARRIYASTFERRLLRMSSKVHLYVRP